MCILWLLKMGDDDNLYSQPMCPRSDLSYTVSSRTFSIVLRLSRDIPVCSRPFSYVLCLFLSVLSFSVVFLIIPSSVPFHVFRLLPFIPLFRLVSFQFSILGSNCSESGSPSDPFTFLFSPNSVFH